MRNLARGAVGTLLLSRGGSIHTVVPAPDFQFPVVADEFLHMKTPEEVAANIRAKERAERALAQELALLELAKATAEANAIKAKNKHAETTGMAATQVEADADARAASEKAARKAQKDEAAREVEAKKLKANSDRKLKAQQRLEYEKNAAKKMAKK